MKNSAAKTKKTAPQGDPVKKTGDLEKQIGELKTQLEALSKSSPENKIALILFSGELDKALASFVIATGAAAMGMDVVMFFTFWGTPILRNKGKKVG